MSPSPLDRAFYERDVREVAPALLHKLLVRGDRVGRIVEVEAYAGADDPASHAYRGPSPRTATMFGPPGHLYVYFTYGMHWCANAVCGPDGHASAVLLRAVAPEAGLERMRVARLAGPKAPRVLTDRDLCRGPARLCQAFGIERSFDGADLVTGDRGLVIADDGAPAPERVATSTRIGLTAGADRPWRWFVAGDPHVSGPGAVSPRQPPRRRRAG